MIITTSVILKVAFEFALGFAIKLFCENGRIHYEDIPPLFGFGPDIVEDGLTREIEKSKKRYIRDSQINAKRI